MTNPTNMMTSPSLSLQDIANVNRLQVKAFGSESLEALQFILVNDLIQLATYNRAVLWRKPHDGTPKMLRVSGQATVNKASALVKTWRALISSLQEADKAQILQPVSFSKELPEWNTVREGNGGTSVLWIPITSNDTYTIGLWVERWDKVQWNEGEKDLLALLSKGLKPAWDQYFSSYSWGKTILKYSPYALLAFLALSLLIRVPLKAIAPCEVVPEDPYLISAPMKGIVAEIVVSPGQEVKKDDLILEYDKRSTLQKLELARKQISIVDAEIQRTIIKSYDENTPFEDFSIFKWQLEREKVALNTAEYHASLLSLYAPADGVVLLDDPESWRGRPVETGEPILVLADPMSTKLRFWISPDDVNIPKEGERVEVVLTVDPRETFEAIVTKVSPFSEADPVRLITYECEAVWSEPSEAIKLGLIGSAVVYGEKVSLFYSLFRKPIAYVSELLGI